MNKSVLLTGFFILLATMTSAVPLSAELYNRAGDVMPGTLPEMRSPDYWIARMSKPDEVILTPGAISHMNEAYVRFISSPDPFRDVAKERVPDLNYWWPGHVNVTPDFSKLSPKAAADSVRGVIRTQVKFMRSKKFGNVLAVEYSAKNLDDFEREMAADRIGDTVALKYGIAVRYTRLRNVPSFFPEEQGITENAKTRWDQWNVAILKIGKPVTVLHVSRTGEYVLCSSEEGFGWVRSEDVAFGSASAIDAFVNAKSFVVCTGDRVPLYTDASSNISSGWFGMGDCLPLASPSNKRMVKVPSRRSDGSFMTETVWLARDADVHVGWLPYTRRNIVITGFKLLDNTYDWTGAWFGRQHETTYRDIFSVFGFKLPWHGGLFTFYGKNTEVMKPEIGKEEQYKAILRHEPFLTIQSCGGHAQLLLGDYNGMPIVLDQHGYGFKDESGKDVEVRRCNIGDVRSPNYFLTRNVTFLELK